MKQLIIICVMVEMYTAVYWMLVKRSTGFIMVQCLAYYFYIKSSILHYKITDGWLCETGCKSDMEFSSFHLCQIKERGKTRKGALPNPILCYECIENLFHKF